MKVSFSFNKFPLLVIIFFLPLVSILSQNTSEIQRRDSILNEITDINKRLDVISLPDTAKKLNIHQIIDSVMYSLKNSDINRMQRDKNGLIIPPTDNWVPFDVFANFNDTMLYDPIFLPIVFDGRILPPKLNFFKDQSDSIQYTKFYLINPDSTFAPLIRKNYYNREVQREYVVNNPQLVYMNAFNFDEIPVIDESLAKKNIFQKLLDTDDPIVITAPEIEQIAIRKRHWIRKGEHSVTFSQNSLSDNWAAGGNSNFMVENYHKVNLNYKKDKISFKNEIEWKLRLQRTPADTLHNITILDDYLRTYSVLGLDAFIKKWSYTLNLELRTPFFNRYDINSAQKRTAFLSPLEINAGVGMSYSLEKAFNDNKYKKLNLTANLSPLSLNYKYLNDNTVDKGKLGIETDKHSRLNIGSTINLNLDYAITRYMSFKTRLKYFTNYEQVIAESENSFNFGFSRYLEARASLYVRFDDSVIPDKKDSKWGYFQYSQTLGFGLTFKW